MTSSRENKHTTAQHPLPVDISQISMGSNQNPIGDWNRLASYTKINGKTVKELAQSSNPKGEPFDQKSNESIEPFLTKHLLMGLAKEKITAEMKTWLTRSANQTSLLGFIAFPLMSFLAEKGYTPPTTDTTLLHHFTTTSTGFEVEEHYTQKQIVKSATKKVYKAEEPNNAAIEAKATLIVDFSQFDIKTGPKVSVKDGGYIIYGNKKTKKLFGIEEHSHAYHFFKNTAKKITIALQFSKDPDKQISPAKK